MHDWFTPPLIPPGTEFPARFDYRATGVAFVYRLPPPVELARIEAGRYPVATAAYVYDLLALTLVRWDVTDGGAPVAITRDLLTILPPDFIGALVAALEADIRWRAAEAEKGVKFDA